MSRTAELLPPTPIRRARLPSTYSARDSQPRHSGARVPAQSRAGVGREILYCGSIQPFTSEKFIEPHKSLDQLSASLLAQNSVVPREQMALKSSGCGAQVHSAAVPETRLWSAGAQGVAGTVIKLDERYVTPQAGAILVRPGREGCGCKSEYVGCAACGNHLGTQFIPCSTHTSASSALWAIYMFLPSAVSPPIPTSDSNASHIGTPDPNASSTEPLLPSLNRRQAGDARLASAMRQVSDETATFPVGGGYGFPSARPGAAPHPNTQPHMYVPPAWSYDDAPDTGVTTAGLTDGAMWSQRWRSALPERDAPDIDATDVRLPDAAMRHILNPAAPVRAHGYQLSTATDRSRWADGWVRDRARDTDPLAAEEALRRRLEAASPALRARVEAGEMGELGVRLMRARAESGLGGAVRTADMDEMDDGATTRALRVGRRTRGVRREEEGAEGAEGAGAGAGAEGDVR
ncbi:hypothetical protein DFH06DRAFT_1296299 [Mycena polygramma]|nr:hypothetical protein DFH06DRAFT_1296299 [Mycena polygramma]